MWMGLSKGLARALGNWMFCFWGILECQGPSSCLVWLSRHSSILSGPWFFSTCPPQAEKEERTVEALPKLWSSATSGGFQAQQNMRRPLTGVLILLFILITEFAFKRGQALLHLSSLWHSQSPGSNVYWHKPTEAGPSGLACQGSCFLVGRELEETVIFLDGRVIKKNFRQREFRYFNSFS